MTKVLLLDIPQDYEFIKKNVLSADGDSENLDIPLMQSWFVFFFSVF